MMNNNDTYDTTSTYQEVLAILDAIDAEYDSFDASIGYDNWGQEIQICPVIYVHNYKEHFDVIFEFEFDGTNGYYYFK